MSKLEMKIQPEKVPAKKKPKKIAKNTEKEAKKQSKKNVETEDEKAQEENRESRIRPVEPMEPLNPLEPIGGRSYDSVDETEDLPDGEVKAKDPGDGFEEVELNLPEELATQGEIVKDVYEVKKKRLSMYEVTAENDISYKGPLSYRHFRIAAWVCMAMTVINIFLGMGMKLSPALGEKYGGVSGVLSFFAELAVFLFLFANFAVIIDKKSSYKNLFILYGVLTVGLVLLFVIVYYRYLGGFIGAAAKSVGETVSTRNLMQGGFRAFNIFLDMLLCTAVVFFIDYRPTKYFTGKKIYIFRAFVAIPILYELACILIKYFSAVEGLNLHPMVSPFLTTKPVFCFLLFVRMAFYVKGRETKFLRHGKTLEDYNAYLKTNRNSFQFAKKFALMALIYGVLDFVFVMILFIFRLLNAGVWDEYLEGSEEVIEATTIFIFTEVKSIGFGGAVMMVVVAPFILLFSYTKSYKKSKIDTLIPIIAVVVIGLIILEGIFRVLCLVPERFMGIFELL